MKKLYFILIILFSIGVSGMYGQCNSYDYELSKTGFGCDLDEGQFCFIVNGNWTDSESECSQYVVDIQYPTGNNKILFKNDPNLLYTPQSRPPIS